MHLVTGSEKGWSREEAERRRRMEGGEIVFKYENPELILRKDVHQPGLHSSGHRWGRRAG